MRWQRAINVISSMFDAKRKTRYQKYQCTKFVDRASSRRRIEKQSDKSDFIFGSLIRSSNTNAS
jgi:hypothetical protein